MNFHTTWRDFSFRKEEKRKIDDFEVFFATIRKKREIIHV